MKHFITLALVLSLTYFGFVQFGNPLFGRTSPVIRLTGQVVEVIDGDTIKLKIGSELHRVQMIGIDAPEYGQHFAEYAANYLSDLVKMRTVVVVFQDKNQYGEPLGEIFLNNLSVNKLMLTDGFAWAKRGFFEDPSWQGLERLARDKSFGLWRESDAMEPWKFRKLVRGT